MQEVQVKEVARREKGRVFFRFDNGTEFTLYRSEIRGLPQAQSTLLMTEDAYLPVSLYEKILTEIVGKRAKKRALFLLERMDRFCHLWNAINSLPEIQGRRVDAHLILGKSYREIARDEGVDKSAVRSSVLCGIEAMKKYLRKNL